MEHLTLDQREAVRAFIAEKRTQNAFLRLNGAENVARRADDILTELESLLTTLPEREFSVAEAAKMSGMHPKSIYRSAKTAKMGRQRVKNGTITLSEREIRALGARKRAKTTTPAAPSVSDTHAAHILANL